MKEKVLTTHVFNFSPESNDGESLTLTTEFITNGDTVTEKESIFLNQQLTLQSYGNSATFNLCGINLNSTTLRELANQLDVTRMKLIRKK